MLVFQISNIAFQPKLDHNWLSNHNANPKFTYNVPLLESGKNTDSFIDLRVMNEASSLVIFSRSWNVVKGIRIKVRKKLRLSLAFHRAGET